MYDLDLPLTQQLPAIEGLRLGSQERSSRGPPFAFRLDLGHSVSSGPYQWWAESLSCGWLRSWTQ